MLHSLSKNCKTFSVSTMQKDMRAKNCTIRRELAEKRGFNYVGATVILLSSYSVTFFTRFFIGCQLHDGNTARYPVFTSQTQMRCDFWCRTLPLQLWDVASTTCPKVKFKLEAVQVKLQCDVLPYRCLACYRKQRQQLGGGSQV